MKHLPQIVNMIGLVFDIGGAVLVWRYGLPQMDSFLIDDGDEDNVKKYEKWSNVGIGLLVAGFVGQLTSDIIAFWL